MVLDEANTLYYTGGGEEGHDDFVVVVSFWGGILGGFFFFKLYIKTPSLIKQKNCRTVMKWKNSERQHGKYLKTIALSGTGKSLSKSEHWSAPVPGGHGWHAAATLEEGEQEQ